MTELLDSRVVACPSAGACCSPPGQVLATGEPL